VGGVVVVVVVVVIIVVVVVVVVVCKTAWKIAYGFWWRVISYAITLFDYSSSFYFFPYSIPRTHGYPLFF
jgi:hypothetical protein